MITNTKKVVYNIIELSREDVLTILLGGTIEEEVSRSLSETCDPAVYRVYCSSPTTLDELHMQLELRKESNEKEEKSSRPSKRGH